MDMGKPKSVEGKGKELITPDQKITDVVKGEAAAKVRECRAGMNRLRNIYRIINGASGITLVGLIITFLVMNTQLFLGNIMKLKFIPGLSLPEILILLVVDFVVVIAILIIILFISVLIGAFVK